MSRHHPAALAALAAAVLAAVASPLARAADACDTTAGLRCMQVDVPLDRSGQSGGTVSLHVEVLPPAGVAKGVLFLVAGGPGQASTSAFGLDSKSALELYRFAFPGYTLVAYDGRGTGRSGFLDCRARDETDWARLAASCASSLGASRDFYTTADHVEDLEAVRAALGVDRIAIWGVSYGTKLALAYARAHPDHVERLLLDSVVGDAGGDPLDADVLRSLPLALGSLCAGGACRAATADPAGDVVALAQRLAAAPYRDLDVGEFLDLVVSSDLDPGLAAELPAAVHAALDGRWGPLLHLLVVQDAGESPVGAISFGLFLATVCGDGPFPWSADAPVAARPDALAAAVAALPPGALGPFGRWAAGFGNVRLCLGWPSRVAAATAAPLAGYPDVPVLALSGSLDMRTPTADAAAVVSQFPHGRLLVVPGVGHSVLTMDPSGCSLGAVRTWMRGGTPQSACGRVPAFVPPLAAFPAAPHGRLDAARTRDLAQRTIREAEAVWLTIGTSSRVVRVRGIAGGTVAASEKRLALDRYAIVPGVTVSGRVSVADYGPPVRFAGRVGVGGSAARHGHLVVAGSGVGRLVP